MDSQKTDALIGKIVEERYRVEALLGAGAMGSVYRARHVKLSRDVAIKVLHAELMEDPRMVARFEREAEVAAKLSHKNVVSVLDVGRTPSGERCIVLELARGIGLDELLDGKPLSAPRAIELLAQLLRGLEHAHARGLVHRDIKPQNIIVEIEPGGAWTPRIVDFGIAALRGAMKITEVGIVIGTPMYMSPEQVFDQPLDGRSDLFGLGMIAYEMLTGRLPFDGDGVEMVKTIVTKDAPSFGERAPGIEVAPALAAFVLKLLARARDARYANATEAIAALTEVMPAVLPRARGSIAPENVAVVQRPLGGEDDFL